MQQPPVSIEYLLWIFTSFHIVVKQAINNNARAQKPLKEFLKRCEGLPDFDKFPKPTTVNVESWGIEQIGWPKQCSRCSRIWCVYSVRRNGEGLCTNDCPDCHRVPPKKRVKLKAIDPYIRKLQDPLFRLSKALL